MDLISITQEKNSTFKAQIRKHSFLSDMSIEDGGKDDAPSPAELVVSSLGFCIGMIINRYCQSHGYESKDIEISMTYLLNDNPKMINSITADIALPPNFPNNRKKAVLNSVKTCVIYNSLNKEIDIDIEIED
jgi:putative redox protein